MGIHFLAATAKKELNSIAMKHTESVNEFYHRIFELWEHAETPMDERIAEFTRMLRPASTTEEGAVVVYKHRWVLSISSACLFHA